MSRFSRFVVPAPGFLLSFFAFSAENRSASGKSLTPNDAEAVVDYLKTLK
ncbi:MAG: hypothetical protein JNL98_07465 [Bryobacterales bacterium]|nr:hypothetical protein [Bryobacterales bacterium]